MSAFVVALVAGIGVAAFVWSQLDHSTGNARPTNTLIGAGVAGLVAFLILLSFLKWVLNF